MVKVILNGIMEGVLWGILRMEKNRDLGSFNGGMGGNLLGNGGMGN